jgi:hypothetical protein
MHVARQASSNRASDESFKDTQTICTFGALDWRTFKGVDEARPCCTALGEVLRVLLSLHPPVCSMPATKSAILQRFAQLYMGFNSHCTTVH